MPISQAQRVQAVVKYLSKKTGKSQAEIGNELGYTNASYFSQLINGLKNSFKPVFLKGLAEMDESINPDFLFGDSDFMLLPGYEQPAVMQSAWSSDPAKNIQPSGVFVPADELLRLVNRLSDAVCSQQETIRSQQETIREMIKPESERGKNVG